MGLSEADYHREAGLQRVVQLNRSPHCTSGHEGRVTPHHFYATRVAQIVSACVNVPAWLNAWLEDYPTANRDFHKGNGA